jgi:hypothetical protein
MAFLSHKKTPFQGFYFLENYGRVSYNHSTFPEASL